MKKIFCTALGAIIWLSGCESLENMDLENAESGAATVEFLDVGQALSVLFRSDGISALYDAGNDSAGFWDTLAARKVSHLDFAIISHWHRDHAGGFLEWDGSVQIDTLFYGSDTGGIWLRDSVLKLLEKFHTPAREVSRGKALPCGKWACKILWPSEYGSFGGNDASAVWQISDGNSRMLFTGDLEISGESGLMELSQDLRANLLQIGHHGSKTSSSLAFLEQVAPEVAVISVGRGNSYGHPAAETLNKLLLVVGDSANIWRTDSQGSILVDWKFGKGFWRGM